MAQMNENQKKEYINKIEFSLKDKQRTETKYINYKPIEWDKFIKDFKEDIKQHLEYLKDNVLNDLYNNTQWAFFYSKRDYSQKTDIRLLKTFINSVTFENNKKFIDSLEVTNNENMLRSFAIKFYLHYYTEINNTMKEVLKEVA